MCTELHAAGMLSTCEILGIITCQVLAMHWWVHQSSVQFILRNTISCMDDKQSSLPLQIMLCAEPLVYSMYVWRPFAKCHCIYILANYPSPMVHPTQYSVGTLTVRIQYLTEHMKKNRKDKSCLRSLIQLVDRRRKLLRILKETDTDKYYTILRDLGLREPVVQKYLQKRRKKKWLFQLYDMHHKQN